MSFIGNFYGKRAYYLHSRRKLEKALPYYEKALEKGTTLPKVIAAYGVLQLRGGEYQRAIDLFDQALALERLDGNTKTKVRINRALAYYKVGRMDKAITAMEDIHAKGPTSRVYQTLGYLYVLDGQLEKGLAYNQEALAYDEEDTVVLDNLGQNYLLLGRWDEARPVLERAYALRGDQSDILYHLALVEQHDGHLDKAVELAEKASRCPMDSLNDATPEKVAKLIAACRGEKAGQ